MVLVIGNIHFVQDSQPSFSPWSISTIELVYLFIAIITNVVLTFMTVIRLYLFRRRITKVLGPRYGLHYTSIIAILVESAAPIYVMVLFLVIPFAMGNPLANIPLLCVIQVQVCQ